ncbi:protein of unknown function [Ruminococcaceae bacterium BL-6]|nr:protein of unknown function [Ruminococcaceae bacterium BL-6]
MKFFYPLLLIPNIKTVFEVLLSADPSMSSKKLIFFFPQNKK